MFTDNSTLDYATLRQEGLRLLERLAGPEWTDFNEHDPGITILEQYCYVLSELAYRCNFSIPDLLSSGGTNPYASLHKPSDILTSQPVTLTDLRKLAIDVEGVNKAWIEKIDQAEPKVFYDRRGVSAPLQKQKTPMESKGGEDSDQDDPNKPKKLIQLKGGDGLEPVNLKGLYRVLIEQQLESARNSDVITADVTNKLHAHRPLCMDFVSVEVMKEQKIRLKANIEIGPLGNADEILKAIKHKLDTFIAPPVPFYTLAERLAAGLRIDEIFDGPRLEHGFIDTEELQRLERKTAVRVSDLIHEIMDVEGVLMVKQLSLSMDDVHWENWWLDLNKTETPVWDWLNSILRLERRQIEIVARNTSPPPSQTRLVLPTPKPEDLEIKAPAGRDRRVGQYYSAQHLFPALYGLGDKGLPSDSDAQRRAQVKQLKAYLLFFDQLLANEFAQLAHVGDLLGFAENPQQTYFSQWVDEPSLGLDTVWRDPKDLAKRLERMVEKPDKVPDPNQPIDIDWSRKQGFLDHLLARFAEHFTDYAQFTKLSTDLAKLAHDKQTWLRKYPELSAGRGTGYDILSNSQAAQSAGLQQRLCIKLGLVHCYLVEHVLLRPIQADDAQQPAPLLADARCADPYSLQISLVLPKEPEQNNNFCRFVEQTVREEAPAHLTVYLCWLSEGDMKLFGSAYQAWVDSQRAVRPNNSEAAFRLRDSRDRLIDWLGIGRTYPLVDLPVSYINMVPLGKSGTVTLKLSQPGVIYTLRDKSGKPLNHPEEIGNGSDLKLTTPVITQDITFTVWAVKNSWALKLPKAIEIIALNLSLPASILKAELLDPNNKDPTAPRIVDFGVQAEVQIESSQTGVNYQLVRRVEKEGIEIGGSRWEVLSETVLGNSQAIKLTSLKMEEDTDIRILAIIAGNNAEKALLEVVLPLKVRANPSLGVTVNKDVVDDKESDQVTIKLSQTGFDYELFHRPIESSEFFREFTESQKLLKISGTDSLWVKVPQNPTPNLIPFGVKGVGDGKDLVLTIPGSLLTEDSYIVVQASKQYTQNIRPTVQLTQALAILVRPVDCPVVYTDKVVLLGKTCVVTLTPSQKSVCYHLRDKDGKPLNPEVKEIGNGSDRNLTTPAIKQDITFTVLAVKKSSVFKWLKAVEIIGLNLSLPASILNGDWLDPKIKGPTAPRIVDYGVQAEVQIEASQVGVNYRLVCQAGQGEIVIGDTRWKPLSEFVSGNSQAIKLTSLNMGEDTDIRILAIIVGNNVEKALFEVILPLKVRANPSLEVIADKHVVDYIRSEVKVTVSAAQKSVSYQLFSRPIRDSEFVHQFKVSPKLLKIPGKDSLWVMAPPNPTPDITPFGKAETGKGGDLSLIIQHSILKEDSLIVVQAKKEHTFMIDNVSCTKESTVQLSQALAILVKPNNVTLRLRPKDTNVGTNGLRRDVVYTVLSGQLGVCYRLMYEHRAFRSIQTEWRDLGNPVCFPKADKGIDALQGRLDFVVTGSSPEWVCPLELDYYVNIRIFARKVSTDEETWQPTYSTVKDLLSLP